MKTNERPKSYCKPRLILNVVIIIHILDNSLILFDSIFSVIYQHYEFTGMCGVCFLTILYCLYLMENARSISVLYQDIINQQSKNSQNTVQFAKCQNCATEILENFRCLICSICKKCNDIAFHSLCLNMCMNTKQLNYAYKIVLMIIIKCLISCFVRIHAIISYQSQHLLTFVIFSFSLSLGLLINLILSISLAMLCYQLKKENQLSLEQKCFSPIGASIVKEKKKLIFQSSRNMELLKMSTGKQSDQVDNDDMRLGDNQKFGNMTQRQTVFSPKQSQPTQILRFLEQKLSHNHNIRNLSQSYDTEPIP